MLPTRVLLPASALLLGVVSLVFGRGPGQWPEFAVHEVAGPVAFVEGAGGNIGVLRLGLGMLVVDSQLASAREEVLAAVEGAGEGGVRFLVNTHWHGDHTGNNGALVGEGVVVAHENVRRRLAGDERVEGRRAEGTPAGDLPVVTFGEGVRLYPDGMEVEVRHVPAAHTDGDSVVFFRGVNVVHAGDVFFNGRFPFVDRTSGGSVVGMMAGVRMLLEETDGETRIIPGHGPLATRADLERYLEMLEDCTARVRGALAEGKDVDTMVAEDLLAPWRDWSWRFIDTRGFLTTLAEELGG